MTFKISLWPTDHHRQTSAETLTIGHMQYPRCSSTFSTQPVHPTHRLKPTSWRRLKRTHRLPKTCVTWSTAMAHFDSTAIRCALQIHLPTADTDPRICCCVWFTAETWIWTRSLWCDCPKVCLSIKSGSQACLSRLPHCLALKRWWRMNTLIHKVR